MSVSQSTSPNAFITVELAESLRNILGDVSSPTVYTTARETLARYDEMFSKKPNVNCRCKEHTEKHVPKETDGENTD